MRWDIKNPKKSRRIFIQTYEDGLAMSEEELRSTTTRILDAAEKLFSEYGFEGVGMRTLAEEAEVNLGAATYHFGSKENLYKETFLRRITPTLKKRMEMLDSYATETGGGPIPLEKIIEAMLRPPFETSRRFPAFARLMARNTFAPLPFMEGLMTELMVPQMMRIASEISRSEPSIPFPNLRHRLQMSAGALLFATGLPFFKKYPGPELSDEELIEDLIRYACSGLRQIQPDDKK